MSMLTSIINFITIFHDYSKIMKYTWESGGNGLQTLKLIHREIRKRILTIQKITYLFKFYLKFFYIFVYVYTYIFIISVRK